MKPKVTDLDTIKEKNDVKNDETIILKKKIMKWKRISLLFVCLFVLAVLTSAIVSHFTVVQASRFEVVDNNGNVIWTLDQNGLTENGAPQPTNQNNNGAIRFVYTKIGHTSGFIQISDFRGNSIETVTFSSYSEEIKINNSVTYNYNTKTGDILFNNALMMGNASSLEKAVDLCLFHFVNTIYYPKK